jgi:Cu(I)/Ag(I) efflux system protein CusF
MRSLVLSAVLALAGAAFAQNPSDMTDGEVRKVDKDAAKLTIKHGEIKNLDMPAMTMVFQVRDPALLDKVKAGDKVKFRVEKAASGYMVTAIEPSR